MKKAFILFMVSLLSVGFISCSSDDDNNVSTNSIVGHWKGSNYQVYEDENLTKLVEEGSDANYDFKFFDDGTCEYKGYHTRSSCNYKLLDKELFIYYNGKSYDTYYIIDYSKKRMKLKYLNPHYNWLVLIIDRVD